MLRHLLSSCPKACLKDGKKGESDSVRWCGEKKACSKQEQKSFLLFAEWPKFPEHKQVLPSYDAILTVPVLLCGDSKTLMSSLS